MKKLLIALGLGLSAYMLSSCGDNSARNVMGYAPIYISNSALNEVVATEPQPIVNGGKIYIQGNTFYQIETGVGVHVIDVSNPQSPQKEGFIKIAGAQEMSITDQKLYANLYNDLVVVDISNPKDVKILSRTENVFSIIDGSVPPESGYFECIDNSKGKVVGWERKMLAQPKCRK